MRTWLSSLLEGAGLALVAVAVGFVDWRAGVGVAGAELFAVGFFGGDG